MLSQIIKPWIPNQSSLLKTHKMFQRSSQKEKTVNNIQSLLRYNSFNQQKCTINNIGYISNNRLSLKSKDSNNKKNFKENNDNLKQN